MNSLKEKGHVIINCVRQRYSPATWWGDLSYVMQHRVPQYSSPIKEASDQKVFEVKVARHGPFA